MKNPWQTENWFVSPFNFDEEARAQTDLPKSLTFHDVTLRDGEQQAGVVFTKYDKVMIGRAINRAGVERLEVGTPGTSSEDKEAVRALNAATLDVKIFSWARNNKLDIAAAKDCGSYGITIELPTSKLLIEKVYDSTLDRTLREVEENVNFASSEGLRPMLLLVDATRADMASIATIIRGTERYVDSYAISDTFGVAMPRAIFNMIRKIKTMTSKPIEIHCHNDFGLATSNTLAAVLGGASVAHVTVNGMGERAGNTALGEVALGAKLLLGIDVKIKLEELYRLSQTVSEISGYPIPPNKPIVGENVFNIESAQSAQWLATTEKDGYALAYPFSREIIDHPEPKVLLSKKSGPYNLKLKLAELRLSIPEERFPEVLGMIYERSLQKKGALSDDEFLEVLEDLGLYKYKQEDLMRG
jgi:isopropylmalate/homocitrate/citramalate synthase